MYTYMCPVDIDCTVLDAGTVYYSLSNLGSKNISVNKLVLQTMSSTGSGNTKCMFAVARAHSMAPTGGTTVSYTKLNGDFPDSSVDIRKSNTGLTMGGAVVQPYFLEIALRTGSEGHISQHTFSGNGLIIPPGQGIVILADGVMVADSSLHGTIEFEEGLK